MIVEQHLQAESHLKVTGKFTQALHGTLAEPLCGLLVKVLAHSCQQPGEIFCYRLMRDQIEEQSAYLHRHSRDSSSEGLLFSNFLTHSCMILAVNMPSL